MSRHDDPMGGLVNGTILLGDLAIRAVWCLAYGLAQLLVALVQAILAAGRSSDP